MLKQLQQVFVKMFLIRKQRSLALVLTMGCLCFTLFGSPGIASAQSTHAQQAPSTYEGQWPDQSPCWDYNAFVISHRYSTYQGHRVEIAEWASPDCGTNWADFQILDGTALHIRAKIIRAKLDGLIGIAGYEHNANSWRVWTQMVYTPTVDACASGEVLPPIIGMRISRTPIYKTPCK